MGSDSAAFLSVKKREIALRFRIARKHHHDAETDEVPMGGLALVGGTIYGSPFEKPIRNGVALIEGGKIAAVGGPPRMSIPRNAHQLDCRGLTIVAGFWNSHVHFFERKWANVDTIPASELASQLEEAFSRYGFTSVFDIGSMWDNTRKLRKRIDSGEVPGPRIRSTGEAIIPPGALPSDQVLGAMGVMKFPAPEISSVSQARDAARKLLQAGVDGIKLFPSSPRSVPLPEGAIEAAVAEAHRFGKPAFVHPNGDDDVLAAVRSGVDVIAHTTPHSGPWGEAILAAMEQSRVALTPTLALWKSFMRHDRRSTRDKVTETAVGQLRAWAGRGGTVLFGTDLGAVDSDPTAEYALMAQAGMSPRQVLASLTTAPAEQFEESKRLGQIAAGLDADLVVLEDDPLSGIEALGAVRYTLRGGTIIYRSND